MHSSFRSGQSDCFEQGEKDGKEEEEWTTGKVGGEDDEPVTTPAEDDARDGYAQ
jgi:hypothetical protein